MFTGREVRRSVSGPSPMRAAVLSAVSLLAVLGWIAAAAYADDVYSWVDKKGVLHLSNQPPRDLSQALSTASIPTVATRARQLRRMDDSALAGRELPGAGGAAETQAAEAESQTGEGSGEEAKDAGEKAEGGQLPEPPPTRSERLPDARRKRAEAMRNRLSGRAPQPSDQTTTTGQAQASEKLQAAGSGTGTAEPAAREENAVEFDWNDL